MISNRVPHLLQPKAGKPPRTSPQPPALAVVDKAELEALLTEAKTIAKRLAGQVEIIREIKGMKTERVLGILAKVQGRIKDLDDALAGMNLDPDWDAKEVLRQAHIISKKTHQAMLRRLGSGPGGLAWEKGNVPLFLGLMVSAFDKLGYPVGLIPPGPDGPHAHRFLMVVLPEGQVTFKVHEALLKEAGLDGIADIPQAWDGHDTPTKTHRCASFMAKTRGQRAAG